MQRPLLRRIQPKNQLESQVNEFKLQKLAEDIVDFKKETEVKVGNIIEKAESVASGAEEAISEVKSLPSKIKNDFEELTNEIVDALKEIKSEGLKGDKGEDADEEAIEKRLLAKIPEIDIDDIAEKASSLVKPTPASLKIIKESVELKDEEIVPKLNKAANLGDLKLSINNIKDWNNKWEDIKGEISRNKGGYHGGGFNNIANASGTVSTGLDTLKFTGTGINSVTQTGRTVTVDISGGSGTVTNIATAGLISGGPITTTGTITTSMATGKLVGRSTAGTGIMEEITVGSGLTLSGGTLTATGGGTGDVVGPASSTDNAIARFDGTTGKLIQNSSATLSDAGVLTVTDIVTSEVKASGSGGLDILNSSGAQVALFGAGGSTGASLFGTTNIGSASADYVQITGGTGATTFTATGSSVNIDITTVPKGTGAFKVNGASRINTTLMVGDNNVSAQNTLHVYGGLPLATVGGTQMILESYFNGYGAGVSFQSRTSSGGTLVEMARIVSDGEGPWSTTASTQDANLRFFTTEDGSASEKMRITANGNLLVGTTSQVYSEKLAVQKDQNSATYQLIRNNNSGASAASALALNAFGNSWGIEIGSTAKNSNALTFNVDYLGTPVERMRLTTDGNLGLGITPNAWHSNFRVLQTALGYASFVGDISNGYAELVNNCYASAASTYNYVASLAATRYSQQLGVHRWYVAGAGTSGAAITFINAMTLSNNGTLLVGTTSASGLWSGSERLIALKSTSSDAAGVQVSSSNAQNTTIELFSSYSSSVVGLIAKGDSAHQSMIFSSYNGASYAERARIDTSGNFLVEGASGDTVSTSTYGLQFTNVNQLAYSQINTVLEGSGGINGYGGVLRFYTKGDNSSSLTERMRIDYSGNATITTSLNVPQVFNAMATATVTANAATITRANRNNKFVNSSAAAMTITLSTASAAAGDMLLVQIYDFSAATQTITWVNTENSTVVAPVLSNGSTTLPLTVGFMWNASTSKWRCIASA